MRRNPPNPSFNPQAGRELKKGYTSKFPFMDTWAVTLVRATFRPKGTFKFVKIFDEMSKILLAFKRS
jgi:hypothetical protein